MRRVGLPDSVAPEVTARAPLPNHSRADLVTRPMVELLPICANFRPSVRCQMWASKPIKSKRTDIGSVGVHQRSVHQRSVH